MTSGSRWLLSLLAAALVPILLPTIYFSFVIAQNPYGSASGIFLVVLAAATATVAHLVVLGIPSLALLHRFQQMKAWTVCLLGFVIGCVPMSIISWPIKRGRGTLVAQSEGEKMFAAIMEASPTTADWISYGEGVMTMGALGAASSAAFWVSWWLTGRSDAAKVGVP